ncbi:hypothetical protein METP3_00658 [Methanosarcinales archaeon]|nr:hypothetical protein METP3_00658 [Methanosarcinales archaeon]
MICCSLKLGKIVIDISKNTKFEFLKAVLTKTVRIIPQAYRDDPTVMRTLYKWLLIGLLIRFIFMPIALHADLISTYHRSYMILNGNAIPAYYTLVQIIQASFLALYQFILPLDQLLMWPTNEMSVPESHWLNVFVENDSVYRALFLFKIPYLFFDMASAIILLHLLDEKKRGMLALKFWMINPIGIFAVYIFGRYETIPIFFVLLSLYFAKKNRIYISMFLLSIAIIERVYPIFFLPIYILALGKDIKEKAKLSFVGLFLFIFEILISKISGSLNGKTIVETNFIDYILGMKFDLGFNQVISIFVFGYGFIILYYIYFQNKNFDSIWKFSLAILLLFYATSLFHPQYFAWFTPFIAIAITKYKEFLKLHIFQIFCFVFITFYWGKALAGWLFAPIDPQFFINIPSPAEYIDQFYPILRLMNMFRSILSGTLIFMLLILLTQNNDELKIEKREN